MKLLLTSGGLTNDVIRNKFFELFGKNPGEISVAFIDTAARGESRFGWVRNDIRRLGAMGIGKVIRIDISEPEANWMEILKNCDAVYVEGGNTFYLLDKIRSSGLDKTLKEIVKNKVYVGISAGSILVTPSIAIAGVEPGDANRVGMIDFTGLNWTDFEVSPHTPTSVPLTNVENYAKTINHRLYAIDDNCAILVSDNSVEVIGTGFSKIY